jgi:hypothetical protein
MRCVTKISNRVATDDTTKLEPSGESAESNWNPQAKSKPDVKSEIDADLAKASVLDTDKRAPLDLDGDVAKWQQNS